MYNLKILHHRKMYTLRISRHLKMWHLDPIHTLHPEQVARDRREIVEAVHEQVL